MGRKLSSCLNEVRRMKNGLNATCIAYRSSKDLDVLFEDGKLITHTQKVHFYNGSIANSNSDYNPYRKLRPLTITNPELLAEWNYKRNSIDPSKVTRSSTEKVWWKCSNGHEWEATINARTRKKSTGCPYCSGHKAVSGVNDLATLFPELLLDWDYENNGALDPCKLTAHSGVKVNWRCRFCGHKWTSTISSRTGRKSSCPNCSMKCTSFGEQAVFFYVKKIFPNAINRFRKDNFELDVFIPEIKTGIEFDGAYFHSGEENENREMRKYEKCRELGIRLIRLKDSENMNSNFCADRTFGIDKLKDKKQLNILIRILLQYIDPESNPLTRRNPSQLWSTIDSIVDVDKDYFDIIDGKFLREESNSFVYSNSDLLLDWDYKKNKNMNPRSITKSCSFKVNWKCHKCGYEWKARVPDRLRGDKCPCCNSKVLVEGVNDFATLFPKELSEWDYDENELPPYKVYKKSTIVAWKCSKCGYKWKASIQDKVIRKDKTGCPNCGRKSVAEKRHQRALKNGPIFKRFPELLKYWDFNKNKGVNINDLAPGSGNRYHWKCPDCGYEWVSSLNNATSKSRVFGCKICKRKNKKTLPCS